MLSFPVHGTRTNTLWLKVKSPLINIIHLDTRKLGNILHLYKRISKICIFQARQLNFFIHFSGKKRRKYLYERLDIFDYKQHQRV